MHNAQTGLSCLKHVNSNVYFNNILPAVIKALIWLVITCINMTVWPWHWQPTQNPSQSTMLLIQTEHIDINDLSFKSAFIIIPCRVTIVKSSVGHSFICHMKPMGLLPQHSTFLYNSICTVNTFALRPWNINNEKL